MVCLSTEGIFQLLKLSWMRGGIDYSVYSQLDSGYWLLGAVMVGTASGSKYSAWYSFADVVMESHYIVHKH